MVDAARKVSLAQYKITTDGSEPSAEFTAAVVSVVVDERLNLPTMFEIRVHDPGFTWADGDVVKEGKTVEIFGGAQTNVSVGGGEITAIEGNFADGLTELVVRGYDKSFRLHREIKHRTFIKQTDSDIVGSIAREAGLTANVDSTTIQHPYVLQYNETDFAFLQRRAARLGYEVLVDKTTLKFRKPDGDAAPLGATLELGKTLMSFRPQRSIGDQATEVTVQGWDPKAKQAIVGQAKTAKNLSIVGDGKSGGAAAQSAFGSAAKRFVVDSPIETQDEANALAKALLEETNMTYVTAEGEASSEPKIRVGTRVEIKGVGTRFGGKYYVTAVTHRFTKEFGHRVEFAASNRRPSPLVGLMPEPEDRHRIEGVVIGVVTNNKNTEKEHSGQVKVKFPWLDEQQESQWARLAPPMAGADRGFLTIPEVNDEVLVAFEHGDPNRPFVVGALWNGVDKHPEGPGGVTIDSAVGGDGKVNHRYWRSRLGHILAFDDSDNDPKITIVDKTGKNYIKIISKDNKLEVQMEGDIQVTSKTGQLSVKANKDVAIESETGKVSIKAKTNVEVTASANVDVKATAGMSLASDATAVLKANAKLDVTSSAIVEVKGSLVKIN